MPQPTISDVHVDVPLTNLSVRFSQSADMFIADQVFPKVRVQNRSDKYYTYDRSFWFKSDAQLRAPGTESAGSGYTVSTDTFSCDVYAIHKDIDDQTRANADSQITMDRDATEFVTQHLLQRREQAWVSTYFAGSVWGTTVTGGTNFTAWDDYASSDPIGDLRAGVMAMAETTAYKPTDLVLGPEVWNKLQDHPDFLERIKYTQKGVVGTDLLAELIGLKRVHVPWSVRNTAAEGVTAAYDFNFGKHALLLHVANSPGLNTVSAGYTFVWSGLFGAGENGIRIKRFRMEQIASDRIEGEEALDQKIVSTELGYFFSGAVA
jgi:hypothetical protein